MAPRCEHTAKVLMCGTRCQRISQFYQHTPCLSVNGITHTCLCLQSHENYITILYYPLNFQYKQSGLM